MAGNDSFSRAGLLQDAVLRYMRGRRLEATRCTHARFSIMLAIFNHMSCCHTEPYHIMFDASKARQDLEDYISTGYKRSSRPIFRLLDRLEVKGCRLLDIGGGIGAIPFELFERGLSHATHNDISTAYVQTFLEEASRRQLQDRVASYEGDFTALHEQIPDAEIVTLDKVICCYPDFESLVRHSSAKAIRWYVFSVPREHWLVRIGMRIDYYLMKWWSGKAFRTYFHPVSRIADFLESLGFRRTEQVFQREWTALLFERVRM